MSLIKELTEIIYSYLNMNEYSQLIKDDRGYSWKTYFRFHRLPKKITDKIIRINDPTLLQYLLSNKKYDYDERRLYTACKMGYKEIIKLLLSEGFPVSWNSIMIFIKNAPLDPETFIHLLNSLKSYDSQHFDQDVFQGLIFEDCIEAEKLSYFKYLCLNIRQYFSSGSRKQRLLFYTKENKPNLLDDITKFFDNYNI